MQHVRNYPRAAELNVWDFTLSGGLHFVERRPNGNPASSPEPVKEFVTANQNGRSHMVHVKVGVGLPPLSDPRSKLDFGAA